MGSCTANQATRSWCEFKLHMVCNFIASVRVKISILTSSPANTQDNMNQEQKIVTSTQTGPRGIPEALFIENVEEYLGGPDAEVEPALKAWQQMIGKYQFMEKTKVQKQLGFEEKIPELERTLEALELLQQKKEAQEPLETHFELADTVYTSAVVEPVDEVFLWLGANTMLAYPLSDAQELLKNKIESAKLKLEEVSEEQAYLRNQITTTQVNIARLFNWDVKRRKQRRAEESENQSKPT